MKLLALLIPLYLSASNVDCIQLDVKFAKLADEAFKEDGTIECTKLLDSLKVIELRKEHCQLDCTDLEYMKLGSIIYMKECR